MFSSPGVVPPLGPSRTLDAVPGPAQAVALQMAALAVMLLGALVYGGLSIARHGLGVLLLEPDQLLMAVLVALAGFVVLGLIHVGGHGLTMLLLGVRPSFGVGMIGKLQPYVSATAPGHRFSRGDYLTVTLAPTVVVSLGAAVLVWWGPPSAGLVMAVAFYLSGCVVGWWVAGVVLRQPPASTFEDLHTGVRVHLPG